MVAACRHHGKHADMGGVYDHALMEKFIRLGVRFMLGGGDVALLVSAGKARASFIHSLRL